MIVSTDTGSFLFRMQGLLADIRKRNIADRVDKEVAEWASQLSTSSPLKYIGNEPSQHVLLY